jgi:RNA polymerase sigma-70 factor (ECF subfamily)
MEHELRRAAVERAYREHVDDVYRVAYAILHDAEAASDATHDAFARAFEHWEQYDTNRSLRAWLHGIVAHAALDALRRRRVRTIAVAGAMDGRSGSTGQRQEPAVGHDLASLVARQELVDEGLASLTAQARAAVVLRHAYGYDYAEIGAFLGTSPGNVGSILTRAHAA